MLTDTERPKAKNQGRAKRTEAQPRDGKSITLSVSRETRAALDRLKAEQGLSYKEAVARAIKVLAAVTRNPDTTLFMESPGEPMRELLF